ncbi:MAG: BamA/TamA family outer membrane protein [Thermoanaerobaculia bacterium]
MKRSIALILISLAMLALPGSLFAFGKNKIVYDEFDWRIYHSTHFDVYYYDEEKPSLQKVVNLAESAYDELSRKFNFQISKKIPIIFYATHSAFEQNNIELSFIPEGVGAFAEPVKDRMVLPIDMPDEKLYALIKHEMTHVFEYEILFQGKFAKEMTSRPPTWLMEGLASFMGSDEDSRDRMVLRDAVVNDQVPSITQDFGGYFAYRFGHAVFRYIVDRYGWDGLRDFIYEYRNTLGSSLAKPLKRAFDVTPEEFDSQFRTWLRKQYLPALVAKGEPLEYGKPFKIAEGVQDQDMSPVPAPSGDLLAALTTYKEDADVGLFNVPERKLLRNLTRGYADQYEYIVAQALTTGPVMGRDVGFSPNGDQIAVFVKKERGRSLLLINALSGAIERIIPMKGVEQQLNPTYSPDGTKIAFHAFQGDRADIFTYDLQTGDIANLTNDAFFDAAPVYSPDGKSIVYSSVVDGYAKLFRIDLTDTSKRYQLTTGDWNDIDAWFSPDGKRIFYASDRQTGRAAAVASQLAERTPGTNTSEAEEKANKIDPSNFATYNIYSLNLGSGEVLEYTDVVGGCFTPVVFTGEGGEEKLVFASYYKRQWQLYITDTSKSLRVAERIAIPSQPLLPGERSQFLPPVEVAIDPDKSENYGGHKMFIEDVEVNAGVASDQTFVSRSVIFMSDMLGNRRLVAALDSVSTFSNFDFLYFDMTHRTNWGVRLFDDRTFFVTQNPERGNLTRERTLYRQTGLIGLVSYPFDRYHRVDTGVGYMLRDYSFPFLQQNPDGTVDLNFLSRSDNFPLATASFTGDSTRFKQFGPISGRRYEASTTYALDTKDGGALSNDYTLDFRQYLQLSSRSLLAMRVFGGYSEGNFPNFYYFGGLNTLRGYDFRSFVGNRAFFGNFEYRFPLIDYLISPYLRLRDIRGSLFFDVGGAYFNGQPFTFMENRQLQDAKAAVGYGISFDLFGLELHWDFARRTDLKNIDNQFRTTFWIGPTF